MMADAPGRFDAFLFVDWSARGVPGPRRESKDSLWAASNLPLLPDGETTTRYFRTRAECMAVVRNALVRWVGEGRRVLLGFDFPYGYPRGFANLLHLPGVAAPWQRTWDHLRAEVQDGDDNRNNRWAVASALNARCGDGPGPLWGCPVAEERAGVLSMRRPVFPYATPEGTLPSLRAADRYAWKVSPGIQEIWKLCYAASVGSQVLLGIPRLAALRDDPALRDVSAVWPFETGFACPTTPQVVHAEIWPGLLRAAENRGLLQPDSIPDRAQVQAMVQWAVREQDANRLEEWFTAPPDLPAADHAATVAEEGWILGAR
jgi:hypothetical protein